MVYTSSYRTSFPIHSIVLFVFVLFFIWFFTPSIRQELEVSSRPDPIGGSISSRLIWHHQNNSSEAEQIQANVIWLAASCFSSHNETLDSIVVCLPSCSGYLYDFGAAVPNDCNDALDTQWRRWMKHIPNLVLAGWQFIAIGLTAMNNSVQIKPAASHNEVDARKLVSCYLWFISRVQRNVGSRQEIPKPLWKTVTWLNATCFYLLIN